MPITDNTSPDIATAVGPAALGVAAARVAASAAAEPLVVDPYAKLFIDAVGGGMWSVFTGATPPGEIAALDPQMRARMQAMVDYIAVRTVFFDQFLGDAAAAGLRQVVILASGLDTRAWRLSWPAGMTVYEIDRSAVLDFKTSTLAAHGAHPGATLVNVATDVHQDWPAALQASGFDPAAPTAWAVEGLLAQLASSDQDLLFERIDELSAPGSRLAAEVISTAAMTPQDIASQRATMEHYRDVAAKMGQTHLPDAPDAYFETKADPARWLRRRGWETTARTADELLARHPRSTPPQIADSTSNTALISAHRP